MRHRSHRGARRQHPAGRAPRSRTGLLASAWPWPSPTGARRRSERASQIRLTRGSADTDHDDPIHGRALVRRSTRWRLPGRPNAIARFASPSVWKRSPATGALSTLSRTRSAHRQSARRAAKAGASGSALGTMCVPTSISLGDGGAWFCNARLRRSELWSMLESRSWSKS